MTAGLAYGSTVLAAQYGYDPYKMVMQPILLRLEPETAHAFALMAAAHGILPRSPLHWRGSDAMPYWDRGPPSQLHTVVWGRPFVTPIGLAAGFDKDATAIDGMLDLGFGFVEAGSVTPLPQPGNDRPRVFRLMNDAAIINRMGFNSEGGEVVAKRLAERRDRHERREREPLFRAPWHPGIVGINLGKNRSTSDEDASSDYVTGLRMLGSFADYLVVNVSSPNTPGLRGLQDKEKLFDLLSHVKHERDSMNWDGHRFGKPPLLVKVAPDLQDGEIRDIAQVVLRVGIDGIVVGNTSVERPSTLQSDVSLIKELGGLSGPPIMEHSTRVLKSFYRATAGKVPLVGVGGISSGSDVYAKIRAGASLVQLYTALVYQGPLLVQRLEKELEECLANDGFYHVSDAVGADNR